MTATALTWALIGLGIVGTTVWGNVEFYRRRHRTRTEDFGRNDMSAFSPTIHEVGARPIVEPSRLLMSRRIP